MARLDVDGDGRVDRGELLAALVDWRRLQGSDAGCAADFSSPSPPAAAPHLLGGRGLWRGAYLDPAAPPRLPPTIPIRTVFESRHAPSTPSGMSS